VRALVAVSATSTWYQLYTLALIVRESVKIVIHLTLARTVQSFSPLEKYTYAMSLRLPAHNNNSSRQFCVIYQQHVVAPYDHRCT